MMSFEEFKEYVKDEVMSKLPDDYSDYKAEFTVITKSTGSYDALMISPIEKKTSCVTPMLNITAAYNDYVGGKNIHSIINELVKVRTTAKMPGDFDKNDLLDFDKCKDRIVPRLVNTANNEEYLRDKIGRTIEDLTIIYAVKIFENESGFAQAAITKDLAQNWEVDEETIHNVAMENLEKTEPLIINIEQALFGKYESTETIEDIVLEKYTAPFFILTNKNKSRGSVMVLADNIMKRITDKFGEIYILPSSIDEVLILPKRFAEDVNELVSMVTSVNSEQVKPEDQLSNNVYTWSIEKGLEIA